MWNPHLQDEFMELKAGEQAFMTVRPKLIQAGYTTLDSIPRLNKRSNEILLPRPQRGRWYDPR